jgi:cell division protein FtsB
MADTEKQNAQTPMKWLWLALGVAVALFLVYRWFAGESETDEKMRKVREAKEIKRLANLQENVPEN